MIVHALFHLLCPFVYSPISNSCGVLVLLSDKDAKVK